ncbi:MAG: sensor histidine kinase [Chakrabartia sp.]
MDSIAAPSRSATFADWLSSRPAMAYGFSIAVYLIAFGIRVHLMDTLPAGLPFISFIPAVMITAYFAGSGPAMVTALASGLSAWFLFAAPDERFAVLSPLFLSLVVYFLVVFLAIMLIHRLRGTARVLDAERAKNQALAEKSAFLFRELQHRVANNMAFLVAILSMQKAIVRQRPDTAEGVFDDAIRRIRLFSSIHRRLHDPDSATRSLEAHFEGLFTDLIDATGARHINCTVHTNGISLTGETLTTLSLIATELMTNAIKHAFPEGRPGEISLYLNRTDDRLIFIVSDNGIGKANCGPGETGLGCTIIEALCEQLHAQRTTHVD